jgi:hypothetical protein
MPISMTLNPRGSLTVPSMTTMMTLDAFINLNRLDVPVLTYQQHI